MFCGNNVNSFFLDLLRFHARHLKSAFSLLFRGVSLLGMIVRLALQRLEQLATLACRQI